MPQGENPRATPYFPTVPAAIDLAAIELEVLQRWQDGKVFDRSLERTATGGSCPHQCFRRLTRYPMQGGRGTCVCGAPPRRNILR